MNHYFRPEFSAYNTKLRVYVTEKHARNEVYYLRDGVDDNYSELCPGKECMFAALTVICPISSDLEIILAYNKRFDTVLTHEVSSYVNTHCAGASQTVQMFGVSDSVGKFQFPHVKSVSIKYPECFRHFYLATSFPRVEQLAINIHDRYTIAQHLPSLTHFQLHDLTCGHFDLKAFGGKNPQIRSVDLELCSQVENFDEVNESFPALESLQLKLKRELPNMVGPTRSPVRQQIGSAVSSFFGRPSRDPVEMVRFRNVTKFDLDVTHLYGYIYGRPNFDNFEKDGLTAIQFDRLESFRYFSDAHFNYDNQIDFVARYKNVTSMDFGGIELRSEEMTRLVDLLPRLKEITLLCVDTDPVNVAQFMQATRLEVVRIVVASSNRAEV